MAERPFAVFDIDGTLMRWQIYHAVSDELARRGHLDAKAFAKVREARMNWKKRAGDASFKTYERAMIELFDASITSLKPEELIAAGQSVLGEYKDQVYTYTRDLIKDLRGKGYLLFAISASPSEIIGMLADYYGFDDFGGSTYEVKNGFFTGNGRILKNERKPAHLKELVAKHGATFNGSVGVGDSEGDIPMLSAVEKPIAFNPTRELFNHAKGAGWKVVVERKNMIYELEPGDGDYRLTT